MMLDTNPLPSVICEEPDTIPLPSVICEEPLTTPVPSSVLNTLPLTTPVPSKFLSTEPLTTPVPSKFLSTEPLTTAVASSVLNTEPLTTPSPFTFKYLVSYDDVNWELPLTKPLGTFVSVVKSDEPPLPNPLEAADARNICICDN